jgi:uncharacterized membrane protein YuzA (DUF378 family)
MSCYGRRCWRKMLGYGLVMLAALHVAVEGLGYVAGFDGDIVGMIFGDGSMWAGIVKIVIGGGGLIIMAAHCRCAICRSATGDMEECDECDMCKDGCTMHEMKCDNCDACKDGCKMHEM